jgi:hypothetical protein
MNNARLAAHIEQLNSQDDVIRAREVAISQRKHREPRDSFPFLSAHTRLSRRVNADAEYRVLVRFQRDATEAEYVDFAQRGYDLMVTPREVIDLHCFGEALSLFKVVRITGLPMMYTGWEALEGLSEVEILVIDGNPPQPLNLSELPNLLQLGISGINVLSATRNGSLRSLGLGFRQLPKELEVDAPLETVGIESRGDVDFAFLSDASNLQRVTVSGAASVSVRELARAHQLRGLELINCKEMRSAGALIELTELESVEFIGLRAVDELDALTRISAKRIWAERNYLFDPDFIALAGGEASNWNVEKYRGPAKQTPTDGDETPGSYPPFFVRPYAVDLFQVAFDNWEEYESLFPSDRVPDGDLPDQLDYIAQNIIRAAEPTLLKSEGLYFDSDSESMKIITPDETVANRIAGILAGAWSHPTQIRRLARETAAF